MNTLLKVAVFAIFVGCCAAGTELGGWDSRRGPTEPPTKPITVVPNGVVRDISTLGARDGDESIDACNTNTRVLTEALKALQDGDTLLVPEGKTFWLNGGTEVENLKNVIIRFDGVLKFQDDRKQWPTDGDNVKECLTFRNMDHVVWTSSTKEKGGGLIDGRGARWWGYINYLRFSENRPRLFKIEKSQNLVIENLIFKDSPYWTFYASDVSDVVIRNVVVDARRSRAKTHDLYNIGAFNTDGLDIAGRNIHVHDCNIWNDDDTVCVKEMNGDSTYGPCSQNMLFERINASGVGMTIGSIGPSSAHTCVKDITFRDSHMENTFKGIYMKSRPGSEGETGEITNVLYHNITINHPTQWGIWIGPQQAVYGGACSLTWPYMPGSKCPVPPQITWTNIVLRDVTVNNPRGSPGVILGNKENPMKQVVFDNVKVNKPGLFPFFWKYYKCENTEGIATGGTHPVPPCFKEQKASASPIE